MIRILYFFLWLALVGIIYFGLFLIPFPQWIIDSRLGDRSSILGLGLGLIAFWFTFRQASQAKTAAQAAKEAAEDAKKKFIKKIAMTDLSGAIERITLIKKYCDVKSWERMADSCEYVVSVLIQMESPDLEQKDLKLLQKARTIFSELEKKLNNAIRKGEMPDVLRLMDEAHNPATKLRELLEKLRRS